MTLDTINQTIERDVRGEGAFEKELEKKAKNCIKKLQEKGKLSNGELQTIYTTNYKRLFSGKISSLPILTKKIGELDSLTNKLIAKHLKQQLNKQNNNPRYKKMIYWACGIDF